MSTTATPNLDYARRLIDGITFGIVTMIAGYGGGTVVRLADFGGHTRTLGTFYGDDAIDRARAAANRAYVLARRSVAAGTNPDVAAIIADHIVSAARQAAAQHGEQGMYEEFVHVGANTALGYCGDGCCGGPECMPESEIPEFLAWETRLRTAVRNAI